MAQRKSLLEEIREQNSGANFNQGVVNSARKTYDDGQQQSQQQGQRTSLLQEIIDRDGMGSLNQDYVNKALGFDGGFGALAGGYIPGEDGQVYMRDYKSEAEILRERMAETAAAKTGTTQQEPTAEPDLEGMSIWDRIKNFFTRDRAKNISEAALTGTGAGYTGAMRTLYEAGQGGRDRENQELLAEWEQELARAQRDMEYYLEEAGGNLDDPDVRSQQYIIDDWQRKVDAMRTVVEGNVQQKATEATTELTHDLEAKTQAATEAAKAGTGKVGSFAVDAAINMLQMGGDAVVGLATGGNNLIPMGFRVFGQSASQAEQAGADLSKQLGYGTVSAGIEIFTEKLFDGVAGIYGKGSADEVTARLIRRLAKTPAGRTAVRTILGMIEEGGEEVISDLLAPAAQVIYSGQSLGESYEENLSAEDVLYDFLIGAAVSGGMNAVSAVNPVPGMNSIAQNRAENAQLSQVDEIVRAYQDQGVSAKQADPLAWATQKVIEGEDLSRRDQRIYDASPVSQQVTEQVRTVRESAAEKVTGTGYVEQVIKNLGASNEAASVLMEGYKAGTASAEDYALGIRDAYKLGEMGLSLEQATRNAKQGAALNEAQFRHAWSLGRGIQTAEANAVDVKTPEGREKLSASLASLGVHSEKATEVYDAGQDSSRYAAAMSKAAALYAANGADLQAIYEAAKSGKTSDIISYLTPIQIEAATEIGAQIRAENRAALKASGAKYQEIRKQAAAVLSQEATNAQALANVNKAIQAAKQYGQQEQDAFKERLAELEAMVAADPEAQNTEAYNKAYDEALEHRQNVEKTLKGIEELEEKRKELQGKQPVKRKKGTVSFEGGEIDGNPVKGVDREKLTRQQKKVVAMVEALADAVNIDYVFFDGDAKGTQGAYVQGGTVYVNINSGMAANKTLAAATLSHELTHYLQEYAPEEYQALKDFVVQEILKKSPEQLDALVKQQLRLEPDLSYDQAVDEIVANACQTMLLDSKAITELARKNMSFAEKVADVIDDLTAKIKAAFEEVNTSDNIALFNAVKAVDDEMDRIRELWDKALTAATENYNAAQITGKAAPEGGVKYSKTDDAETTSIKEQIQASADMLNGMKPAANVRVSDMPKGIQKQRQWIVNRLRSSGYAVSNQEIGTIEFTPRQINTGLSYLNEPGEIAAFAALPAVLKRGRIIDEHGRHKSRPRGSVTIAAPVVINGVRGNMAVALTQTSRTHYHTHRILMPDGSTFVFENENAGVTPAEDQSERTNVSRPSPRRSEESVTEKLTEVKHQEWDDMSEEEKKAEINATMTMQQAKAMIDKAYTAGGIRDWYEEYRNGDQWLRGEGASEVAMYIENEYELQRKYINSNPHLVDYDFTIEDVLEAYLAGTLTGKVKKAAPRVDVSQGTGYQDSRFYAPQFGDGSPEAWELANSKSTKKNQAAVQAARKGILFAAHEGNLEKTLGITAAELNKKLRTWSRYSANARSLSMRINNGVAPENQWTGIQNSAILNSMTVTDEDIRSMVKDIEGESSEYQRGYIGSAMLALDTHIDWSWLSFDFKRGSANPERKTVRGFYENAKRKITIGGSSVQNTVSHEMGHALDYQWERDLFGSPVGIRVDSPLSQNALVERLIPDEDGRIFYRNFRSFIDELMDVSDNYSNYTMEPTEIFARFVAKFVEWTQDTAGAPTYKESYFGFSDKFTTKNYMDFAKLLQEKAAWDARRSASRNARFQVWDNTTDDTAAESNGRELAYTRLQAENAILSETVKSLRKLTDKQSRTIERLQERLHLTKTQEVRESDARKLTAQLIREAGSTADKAGIAEQLKALGDYILQTPAAELDEAQLKAKARSIASEILENAQETFDVDAGLYQEIKESIRGRKLTIRPEFLGELDVAGGFDSFRKRNFGKFTLARSDSESIDRSEYMTVDQFYTDIAAQYPGLLPQPGEDTAKNEGDYIQILASMFDAGDPLTVNPYDDYMGEASEELANRIVFDALDGIMRPTAPTDADRAKSRREALQQQIQELKAQEKLDEKSEKGLVRTVYDLTLALDKAESKYRSLRAEADYRTNQVREEGVARAAEVKAKERERAAEKIRALKEHYQDVTKRARERREESAGITKYRAQVQKKAGKLYEMLMKNDDKLHVPEVLKAPLAEFLSEIDFSSKRLLSGGAETKNDQAFGARLMRLQQLLSNQQDYINGTGEMKEDLGGYIDVSPDSLEFLKNTAQLITQALGEGQSYTINRMNAAQLKDLSNFLSSISSAIRNMNHFMANARFESVREAASQDADYMKELGRAKESAGNRYRNALVWKNGVPYYIFKRFGAGGQSIFEGFTKGWEKMAFNAQEIIDFTEKTYTDKEVREWKKQEHEITLSDGNKIAMTTAQIMELGMLLNREQALKHIEKGGVRIGDIETKKGKKHDTAHYHLSYSDIMQITGKLTERQQTVAKALQQYMAVKGAEWGNEISMRRFGYNFYVEGENYYPIRTDSNDRAMADTDAQTNSMFRLLNLSSSKALNPKASNALIVGDIFDTFADHMADMAKLNGMGLPILDAIKWFNYKERIDNEDGTYDTRTLQAAMEEAFGGQAQHYFRTLMKDINGVTESGDRGADVLSGLMGNFKAASVGANLRVALLQPTSYIRALTVLKPQYLAAAFAHKNAYQEAMKYSGSAVWKSLGYYDTDISKGMRGQIQHNDSVRDKIVEASMKGAELGDKLTWGRLWIACKLQVRAQNRSLSGDALMQATADLFREVIYSSQVMDSTLTRSEWMRSKSNFDKLFTPFMAEPTLSYNILLDAASSLSLDERRYGKAEAWQRNAGKIGHAYIVYLASAAFNALAESIWDAVRDPDDNEEFWEKFLQALFGEDSPLEGNLLQDILITNKLPLFKDLWSMLSGYSSSNIATDSIRNIYNAAQIWWETYQLSTGAIEKATKITSYGKMTPWGKIYKTLQGLSQLTGVPMSGFTRDALAIWNTIMNGRKDEWKIKTYGGSSLSTAALEGFEEYVQSTGLSKKQYTKILDDADANGGSSPTQDELGAYLMAELDAGNLTEDQAQGLWKSRGWSEKHDFNWWRSKNGAAVPESTAPATETAAPKAASTKAVPFTPAASRATEPASSGVTDFEGFKSAAPIYGNEKKAATYSVWESSLRQSGMTLERFTEILGNADTDGNDSLKQDELGYALRAAINNGEMSFDQASAVWNAQGWSAKHGFGWWSGKH